MGTRAEALVRGDRGAGSEEVETEKSF